MTRTDVPRPLEREVKVEAGHRCAIPTCRQTPVEVAHIIPWHRVTEHTFDNLIALCPTCHARYDRGEIDRQAMKQYKANLVLLNSRYGDLEKRVLQLFSKQPEAQTIKLPGGTLVFVMYLLEDKLLEHIGSSEEHTTDEFPNYDIYRITPEGRAFIRKWLAAQPLE